MERPNDRQEPDRPAPIISDEEVNRLLYQAQSLAEEIIAEVGVNAIEEHGPAPQLGGPEPDALSAVDLVTQDLAELKETLEEASPEIQQALLDALSESDAREEAGPQDVRAVGPPNASTAAAEAIGEAADLHESGAKLVDAALRAEESEGAPDSPAAASTADADPTDVTVAELPSDGAGTPAESKVEAVPESKTIGMVRSAVFFVPNTLVKALILLDRPFAWVPDAAKNVIGAVGIASLVTGAGAMFMPRMMPSNPYATMEPLPHPAPEAQGEHGAEHSEKSEPEAAPPKEHEEKPAEHGESHH